MLRLDFYHLQKNTLDEALPKLLAKAYETGEFIKLKVGSALRVDFLNTLLWTFDEEAFLPHGAKKDGFCDMQPIYISSDDDVPNGATLLFLADGADIEAQNAQNFKRIFVVFDGHNENELSKARRMWKNFAFNEAEKHYWQQTDVGKWEEKTL